MWTHKVGCYIGYLYNGYKGIEDVRVWKFFSKDKRAEAGMGKENKRE